MLCSLLERHGIRGVPVCTPGEDEVLGIISRSIIKRALASGHGDRPVKSWMARNFASCEANQTLSEVEVSNDRWNTLLALTARKYFESLRLSSLCAHLQNLLVQNDAGRLPVLENGKLVGLITRTDLLRQHAFYHVSLQAGTTSLNAYQLLLVAKNTLTDSPCFTLSRA
jgi:tRNA nucleotidyltransferase (CCA-adding enzyme)